MGKRLAPGVTAGVVLWGVLTVACSSAVDRPAPGGASWGGTVGASSEPEPEPRGPALALSWHKDTRTDTVYRVDPRTMRLTDPFRLESRATMVEDLAPDGSLLLAAPNGPLQVVDLDTMRRTARVDPGVRGLREAAWVGDDTAILVVDAPNETKLIRIRTSTGEVLDRESVPGAHFAYADTGDGVVLLTHDYPREAPPELLPATLAVMDAEGAFATVELDAIGAGFHDGTGEGRIRVFPALAVRGSTATVVGTDGAIVSVDLTTLDVTAGGADDSLMSTLASWFVPPAHAKTFDGAELRAEWAGPDALLVSGYRSEHPETWPVGALLLDPDDWSATVVDDEAYSAQVTGDHLLASKSNMIGDGFGDGIGLRSYDPDGELEWQALGRQFVRVIAIHRGIAYVEHGWSNVLVSSIDLDTGEVLATRRSYVRVLSL